MTLPRFYSEQDFVPGLEVTLDAAVSRHIGYALRLKQGDVLTLFNGRGGEYTARVTECRKKDITVMVDQHILNSRESGLTVSLNVAISKGERMDLCIQKATELGVSQINTLFTANCEVKLTSDRAAKKTAHWQRIAISSCEQCGRNIVPLVMAPVKLARQLEHDTADLKLLLSPGAPPITVEKPVRQPTSIALLCGPEGGFSSREELMAESRGYTRTGLGPRIFRAETAPLVALSLVQFIWGDLH